MKNLLIGIGLASLLSLSWGCSASHFACTTEVSFNPKTGEYFYRSCKDQQNLHAKIGNAEISTTASTPEAAIAAASNSLARMTDLLGTLIPLLQKAALMATPPIPPVTFVPGPVPNSAHRATPMPPFGELWSPNDLFIKGATTQGVGP